MQAGDRSREVEAAVRLMRLALPLLVRSEAGTAAARLRDALAAAERHLAAGSERMPGIGAGSR